MQGATTHANTAFKPGRPTVVVIGGGFGGIQAIRRLHRADANILLLDKRNFHLFQPLLYQVATSVLTPSEIAFPLRRIFAHQRNVSTLLAEVNDIDPQEKTVTVGSQRIGYDYLVLAAGARTNYFGQDDWEAAAPGLKTIDDAMNVRNRVLAAFEHAEVAADEEERANALTFVVVGGGATGVELSGAIQELAVDSISRDFRFADTSNARVVLVEGGDTLLSGFSAPLREYTRQVLSQRGVEVMLDTRVTDVDEHGVTIAPAGEGGESQRINSSNVIWAAGVHGNPLGRQLAEHIGMEPRTDGRIDVEPNLTVPGFPDVYVVGDLAAAIDQRHGGEVPGVAPGAMQMGAYAGRSIALRLKGKSLDSISSFTYRDKGSMATIGRARAVAEVSRFRLKGLPAWLAWGGLHIMYLVGFSNRVITMLNWLFTYVFYTKGSRLITNNVAMSNAVPTDIAQHGEDSTSQPSPTSDEDSS